MTKYITQKLGIFFAILMIISSCSDVKNLTYFQKSKQHSFDTLTVSKFYVPKIQTGDLLSISVNSLSPEASSFFNPYSGGSLAGGTAATGNASPGINQLAAPGYLVDSSGQIQYPIIGNIKVSGFTTKQVRDTIKSLLNLYLKEPTVIVRFLNFKITLLGEVAKPEVYNIPNEMITLPEAISMAGDLTINAQRDSIQIIRDVNGKKMVGVVNLNNRDVFNSPYYYLHANDLIYVRPSKYKAQHDDRVLTLLGPFIAIASLLLLIFRR